MNDTWENDRWPFGDWWRELNQELAKIQCGEAGFGDARYYYNSNYSPMTAARLILETAGEARKA
jgi:hypothetical protein